MTADVMSQSLEQVMQMTNQLFSQNAQKDKRINELKENLEKCYNAHPELKAIVEEKPAPKKGTAKKV